MSDESLEQFERQIASVRMVGSPVELRGAVLDEVKRELRAARWDRRLARAAAALLVVAVGLNVAAGWLGDESLRVPQSHVAASDVRPSLVDAAVVVAEATDAATGKRIARQLAAISGRSLTADETAAIDAAIERPASHVADGRRG
jgi:hypothetical protein